MLSTTVAFIMLMMLTILCVQHELISIHNGGSNLKLVFFS